MVIFFFDIITIYLYSNIKINLDYLIIEKRFLFPISADLYKFLKNYLSNILSNIQNLFKIKPYFINTKIIFKKNL
jgi:hypothetical protein